MTAAATGPTVLVGRDHAVTTVTINRPEKLNALDAATRDRLCATLEQAARDVETRAVVLTGTGRAFCVGQDLGAPDELVDAYATVAGSYNAIVRLISTMAKPVVAAVNGLAVGAGFGFALACDIRIAAESASFAASFARVGLVPDSSVSWHLVREIGRARAFELAASGRSLPAAEAYSLGLLNEVVPDAALEARALAVAGELARGPARALAHTKRIFAAAGQESFEAVAELEAHAQGHAARSAEHAEGRAAFIEKRQARYPGAPA